MKQSANRIDLPVVLSLAGIVSVAAVIGAAAFHGGVITQGTRYITAMFTSSGTVEIQSKTDLSKEISRLNRELADLSAQLKSIRKTQTSTTARVDKIEDAFSSTASLPASSKPASSPYFRILETGWNADDMVTRKQKRDRIALLKSEAIMPVKGRARPEKSLKKIAYAVELASYQNIITARKAWQRLTETNNSLLDKLEPHLMPTLDKANKKGRVKLIVGPIKTAARAAQVCSTLRSSGQVCQERLFSPANVMVVSAPQNSSSKSTE